MPHLQYAGIYPEYGVYTMHACYITVGSPLQPPGAGCICICERWAGGRAGGSDRTNPGIAGAMSMGECTNTHHLPVG